MNQALILITYRATKRLNLVVVFGSVKINNYPNLIVLIIERIRLCICSNDAIQTAAILKR